MVFTVILSNTSASSLNSSRCGHCVCCCACAVPLELASQRGSECLLPPQVLMWSTGFTPESRDSKIDEMPESMRAVCWNTASWDTPSTKSPSLNSATIPLGTCAKVQPLFLNQYVNIRVCFSERIVLNNSVFSFEDMASLNLNEGSSGGGSEQDTLAPLPPTNNPWPLGGQPFPYPPFPTAPPSFPPGYSDPCHSFHSGSAGSQHSEGEYWGPISESAHQRWP